MELIFLLFAVFCFAALVSLHSRIKVLERYHDHHNNIQFEDEIQKCDCAACKSMRDSISNSSDHSCL